MKTLRRGLAALPVALGLAACAPTPDLSAAEAQRARPVQRYDQFLAVAAGGQQLVAGAGNALLRSTDGALTWTRQTLPAGASIIGMSRCADGSVAALDFRRRVWLLAADGSEWQPQAIDGDFNPVALSCDPRGRLWVVGSYSTVLSSDDRGRTWKAQPPGEDAILTAVQFLDADHGYIAGEFGTLLVTRDGGASWTKQAGLPAEFYPYAMRFISVAEGWVSGPAGAILHTADGGRHWTAQANPTGAPVYALPASEGRVMALGASGQVLAFADGGWHAAEIQPRVSRDLDAGLLLDDRTLLVAGGGGTLQRVVLAATSGAAATEVRP